MVYTKSFEGFTILYLIALWANKAWFFSMGVCSKHRYWGQQVIRSSLCLTLFSSDTIQSRRWFGWPTVTRVLANWWRFSANTCVQPDVEIFQLWNLGTHLHLSLSPTTLDFIGKLLDGASNIVSGFQVAPVPQTCVSTAMWRVLYRDHSWVKSSSEIKDCSQIGPCHSFFVSKLFLSFMQPLDISLWDLCQKPIIFRMRKLEKS